VGQVDSLRAEGEQVRRHSWSGGAVFADSGKPGALLITLPAPSLPSMVMVGRALSWRITLAMAVVVGVAGLVGALLLWLLL